jgi:hypothetical protein
VISYALAGFGVGVLVGYGIALLDFILTWGKR